MQSKNSVITWVVILVIILLGVGAYFLSNKENVDEMKSTNVQDVTGMVEVKGSVAQMFEGQNILSYSFSMPESASSTAVEYGKTLLIKDADGTQKASIYFSYEGARGFSAKDFFDASVSPNIDPRATQATSSVHHGSYDWYHVETGTMAWDIAAVKGGEWLIFIRSNKVDKDFIKNILETAKGE